ncbi:MAG TPA: response regulator transcription factor [Thiotrichales bacterium]|nr:response regulator transcription factor [Thiotrichales bacterium]
MRIALLEDDTTQAEVVSLYLESAGHQCFHFERGEALIRALATDSFDLLVLDWMLPDMDGDEVLRWVRDHLDWRIPVLFVTQKDEEEDIVRALEAGADDYMVKPLRMNELLARVKAVARRSQAAEPARRELRVDLFELDPVHRVIRRGGIPIELTRKEFDLAWFLFRNQGRIVSRAHLLEEVWGVRNDINTRTVDTHVSRIRNKLGLVPENGWQLVSVYQHGYRLDHLGKEQQKQA